MTKRASFLNFAFLIFNIWGLFLFLIPLLSLLLCCWWMFCPNTSKACARHRFYLFKWHINPMQVYLLFGMKYLLKHTWKKYKRKVILIDCDTRRTPVLMWAIFPQERGLRSGQGLFSGLMRKEQSRNVETLPQGRKGNSRQTRERVIKWLSLRWKEELGPVSRRKKGRKG